MTEQRREDVRLSHRFGLCVKYPDGTEEYRQTSNISGGGMCFATRRRGMEEGQRGTFVLDLDGDEIAGEYVVCRIQPVIAGVRVGVQFVDMEEHDQHAIVRVIFKILQEQRKSHADQELPENAAPAKI